MNIKVKLCECSWPNIILSIINLSPKCQRSFHSLGHTKINICRRVVSDPELCLDRPSDLRRQKWPGPTPQSQWGSYAPICHLSPAVSAPPPRPMAVRPNCNRCSGPGQHGPFASFRPKKMGSANGAVNPLPICTSKTPSPGQCANPKSASQVGRLPM